MAGNAERGRRIGFVDYDPENYHANVFLAAIRNDLANRRFTVAGCTGMKKTSGRAWAEKNHVPYFDRPEELNANVDGYMILAPSNPEVHPALCQQVFPFGKTTYVDKTFTTDLAAAKKIFALADKHKVKMQTTSALRYTNVQAYVREIGRSNVKHMVAWGGGRSFGEYAIHPTELVISCMGSKAQSLRRRGRGPRSQLLINFSAGRTAVINVYVKASTPYAAAVTTAKETKLITVDASRLFIDTASAVLDLFESGKPNIDRAESLVIRRILDAAKDPRALKRFVKL